MARLLAGPLRPALAPVLRCLGGWRSPVGARRGFAYEDTFAYRLHGPKPKVVVVHPVLAIAGRVKPWSHLVDDAVEALSLARSLRWDILPGPNEEPKGGWDDAAWEHAQALEEQRRLQTSALTAHVPEGWHLDRGEAESDDEFDVHEEAWKNDTVKRQWAETCVVKVRHIDPNTYVGKGKMQEMALYIARNPCDIVFFNTSLTPTQSRNLETIFNNSVLAADAAQRREEEREVFGKYIPSIEVYDRNRIVLEIFHLRAQTPTAKLQVKMARLEWLKSRLTLGTQARLQQAIKMLQDEVGPFRPVTSRQTDVVIRYHYESEPFETERKLLADLEKRLKKRIATAVNAKKLHQSGRLGLPIIGIVGYTNVGKTTMMNALTGSDLRERDLFFQTLDSTYRRMRLPSGGNAIVVDSIGFIQNFPHTLLSSFKLTMDELAQCDIFLHVRDMAHPQRKLQKETVLQTLRDAGIPESKLESNVIEVWNKIDLLPSLDYVPPEAIPICAKDGTGMQDLLQVIDTVVSFRTGRRCIAAFPESRISQAIEFFRRHGAPGAVETLQVGAIGEATAPDGTAGEETLMTIEAVLPDASWRRWSAEVGLGRVLPLRAPDAAQVPPTGEQPPPPQLPADAG